MSCELSWIVKDIASEHPERFFVAEIVREKIFMQYRNEVPYACQVNVVSYKTRPNAKDFIQVEIIVEKITQKIILIGKASTTWWDETARQVPFLLLEVFGDITRGRKGAGGIRYRGLGQKSSLPGSWFQSHWNEDKSPNQKGWRRRILRSNWNEDKSPNQKGWRRRILRVGEWGNIASRVRDCGKLLVLSFATVDRVAVVRERVKNSACLREVEVLGGTIHRVPLLNRQAEALKSSHKLTINCVALITIGSYVTQGSPDLLQPRRVSGVRHNASR
ncbi:unnamed protein product [Ilex paraguariensis]|uniref:Uncharacterized protein n=1 Tax=Ilex paraguariensis TaxID=185542 RepID=A0ABC8S5C9_9AQUA